MRQPRGSGRMPNHQNPLEFYETPRAFIRCLFQSVKITGRLIEPCVGSGAIVTHSQPYLKDAGATWTRTNDIDPRWRKRGDADTSEDATSKEFWDDLDDYDFMITNPAFSTAPAILTHGLRTALKGVALYVRISFNEPVEADKRGELLRHNPPNEIIFLPRFAYRRSPKTGDWSTDSMTCCWMVWRNDNAADMDQRISYAEPWVLEMLKADTEAYRDNMDRLTKYVRYRVKSA